MNDLHRHPLFQTKVEFLTPDERVALSYQRARLVLKTHGLSVTDVQHCTPRFWALMNDPICCLDVAMFTLLAAHVGLTIGTLSRHLKNRPDLRPLVDSLLRMDTVGIYLLTERGHGLDAFNIETTATKTETGFTLHSPREEAWKFMPASTPIVGIPKVALVMAKLMVDGEYRGSRFFIVPVCNERSMYEGVTSLRLPPRSGTCPFDFSMTHFNNVHLPPTALVASDIYDFSMPKQPLEAWWDELWRIQLGTLAVPAPWVSSIKAVALIAGRYSMHRTIAGKENSPTPIISFRTQQLPIVNAVAIGMVLDAWYPTVTEFALHGTSDHRVRHALSVIVKATICRHFQRVVAENAERCGAQGTFEHNFMARIENDGKGVIIAEGDILTLCIRLFSELLQDRYSIPLPGPSDSLLAQHAHCLLTENRDLLRSLGCTPRSEAFNGLILPQCQPAIEAIGHALAYSAAKQAGLPQNILDIYECAVVRLDSAWYCENGISRMAQRLREHDAISEAMPHLSEYLDDLGIEDYVSAPILSDARWKQYVKHLPTYTGHAQPPPSSPPFEQLQAML